MILLLRPRVGTVRCPYCGRWAVRPGRATEATTCEDCGTLLAREGRGPLTICSCPTDERMWVGRALPKLRRLRRELRPVENRDL